MTDPCKRKKHSVMRLVIGTKLSKHRQAEVYHGQKCRCPGTFTVEHLGGGFRESKIWALGPTGIFKCLNSPCRSSSLKVGILLSIVSLIFSFYCNWEVLQEPNGYARWNKKMHLHLCYLLPPFLCFTVS